MSNNSKLSLAEIANKINTDSTYDYKGTGVDADNSREEFRKLSRELHGYDRGNHNGDIKSCTKQSPLNNLINENKDIKIYCYSDKFTVTKDNKRNDHTIVTVSAQKTKAAMDNVDVLYDKSKLSEQDVTNIQLFKAGNKTSVVLPAGKSMYEYKEELTSKGCYLVVRAEVQKFFEPTGEALKQPQDRISYYTNWPKLTLYQGKPSFDFNYFADKGTQKIKQDKEQELKDKWRDIALLNAKMAAKHNEGINIGVPRAFLYGLEQTTEQGRAKKLFIDSIIEAAKIVESNPDNYQGFTGFMINVALIDNLKDYAVSKIGNNSLIAAHTGDAGSPNLIASGFGGHFADCIMGEPLSGAGNGALGSRADSAKEENDTRIMGGAVQAVFNPAFNKKLLENKKYNFVDIPRELKAIAPTKKSQGKSGKKKGTDNGRTTKVKTNHIVANKEVITEEIAAKIIKGIGQIDQKFPSGTRLIMAIECMCRELNIPAGKQEKFRENIENYCKQVINSPAVREKNFASNLILGLCIAVAITAMVALYVNLGTKLVEKFATKIVKEENIKTLKNAITAISATSVGGGGLGIIAGSIKSYQYNQEEKKLNESEAAASPILISPESKKILGEICKLAKLDEKERGV